MSDRRFIPAAGKRWLTPLFDPALRLTMRERRWRPRLVEEAVATGPATILDVGCGTGTLTVQLARRAPDARVIGLDGDPEILERARAKSQWANVGLELLEAMADEIPLDDASVECCVTTLVLHHLAPDAKARALAEMRRVLTPGGRLLIADYGRPQDPLMRFGFGSVQLLDGFASTRPHVAGELPSLIGHAGFTVQTLGRLRTLTGTLELLAATPNHAVRRGALRADERADVSLC
jgi:SAM-dependent methyltransferase